MTTRRVTFAGLVIVCLAAALISCNGLFDEDIPEVANLLATPGDGVVTLSWVDPVFDAFERCVVEFGMVDASLAAFAGDVLAGGTLVAGLENGSEYRFVVTVITDQGRESDGVEVTAIPLDLTPPAEVGSLSVIAYDAEAVVSWSDPGDPDFDHCEIYFGTNDHPDTLFSGPAVATGTTIPGLLNGYEHTFHIVTVDHAGNISSGQTARATPAAGGLRPLITQFYQCDPAWGTDPLGVSSTICAVGTTMTCAAMMLSMIEPEITPKTLNAWLMANGGYNVNSLIWVKVTEYSGGYFSWIGNPAYDLATIKTELQGGNPVLVSVLGGAHWVLVFEYVNDGTTDTDFRYHDTAYDGPDQVFDETALNPVSLSIYRKP